MVAWMDQQLPSSRYLLRRLRHVAMVAIGKHEAELCALLIFDLLYCDVIIQSPPTRFTVTQQPTVALHDVIHQQGVHIFQQYLRSRGFAYSNWALKHNGPMRGPNISHGVLIFQYISEKFVPGGYFRRGGSKFNMTHAYRKRWCDGESEGLAC